MAGWLCLSALCQIPSKVSWAIRRIDILNVVPWWSLFAPNPVASDFRLMFRDRLRDGSLTEWRNVDCDARRVIPLLWKTRTRRHKATFDFCSRLTQIRNRRGEVAAVASVPYMALLNLTVSISRPLEAVETQFAIAEIEGYHLATPVARVVFVSRLHSLETLGHAA
jgi:hypothetical protein